MKKLCMLVLLLMAGLAFADKYDKWANEDVKVLMTRQEKDTFKALKTEAEKEQFQKDFWAKRDPSPGTPQNEFKAEYENRLQFVREKMKGMGQNPVDTDMGRTRLLLGPPTNVTKTAAEPPHQIWIYQGLPQQISAAEIRIDLVGAEEGGWHFNDSKKANEILDKARDYYASLSTVAAVQAPQTAPAPQAPVVAAMPAVSTPAVKAALDAAAAGNLAKDVAFEAMADGFQTSKGKTFITVAADSTADVAAAKVGVRVVKTTGETVKEGELPFASADAPAGHFSASVEVEPGQYHALIVVIAGDKSGAKKVTATTPDPTKLSISSLVLVKDFMQVPTAQPEETPYTFGKTKIRPSIDHAFAKTDELRIMYEVYNFQPDPATGKPNLEMVSRFQQENEKPKETSPAPVQGFPLEKKITVPTGYPLTNFPAGEYTLTIKVTDKVSNQTTSQEARFTVK